MASRTSDIVESTAVEHPHLIPLGYMLKRIIAAPVWMNSPSVSAVCSVSNCVSTNFVNYIPFWKHNGWWMFNDQAVLQSIAVEAACDLRDLKMFYYEAFEKEFDGDKADWLPIMPESSFLTDVRLPKHKVLRGFDVVSYSLHASPECSPLSCNSLAGAQKANRFCLLDGFESARRVAEQFGSDPPEPGPFRIIAVYEVNDD